MLHFIEPLALICVCFHVTFIKITFGYGWMTAAPPSRAVNASVLQPNTQLMLSETPLMVPYVLKYIICIPMGFK